jgi:hypothetical protein
MNRSYMKEEILPELRIEQTKSRDMLASIGSSTLKNAFTRQDALW